MEQGDTVPGRPSDDQQLPAIGWFEGIPTKSPVATIPHALSTSISYGEPTSSFTSPLLFIINLPDISPICLQQHLHSPLEPFWGMQGQGPREGQLWRVGRVISTSEQKPVQEEHTFLGQIWYRMD